MANLPKTKPARQYTEEELEQIRTRQRRQSIISLAQNFITAHLQGGRSVTPAEIDYYFRIAETFIEKAEATE